MVELREAYLSKLDDLLLLIKEGVEVSSKKPLSLAGTTSSSEIWSMLLVGIGQKVNVSLYDMFLNAHN